MRSRDSAGESNLMVIIIFLVIALLGLAVYLSFALGGIGKAWDSLKDLTGMNNAEDLINEGRGFYESGKYGDAISAYKRLLERNPDNQYRDDARLMLSLSYAATRNYKRTAEELEKLKDDPLAEEGRETISEIYDYVSSDRFDKALNEWQCCEIPGYGYLWVYGICWERCRGSGGCPEENCRTGKPD